MKRLGFYVTKQGYFKFYKTMQIHDERIDDLFMDIMDILGKNFDTTLDQASNVAEQIAEKVNEIIETDEK